jgi:hypothetical protein
VDLLNNIAPIDLAAKANKTTVGFFTLKYTFDNSADCERSTSVGDSDYL